MVIDTSAVIAILLREPELTSFARAILTARVRLMSAVSWVEASMVIIGRAGQAGGRDFDRLVTRTKIEIVPVQHRHTQLAREAFVRYGRGRHPAKLNCGDCFTYALAKATGEPLLFKGNDFSQTDLPPVVV